MTRKVKKLALGVAALLATTLGAVGVVSMTKPTATPVVAEGNTFTVDVLGNAQWTATENATAYQWSYTVDGITYPGNAVVDPADYITVTNGAFIGEALTKAAQSAVAKNTANADGDETVLDVSALDVQINVAPIVDGLVGEPVTLTPAEPITQYINYGYTTYDITDKTDRADGDGYDFGATGGTYFSAPSNGTGSFNNAGIMQKNALMTLGLQRISYYYNKNSYSHILGFFGGSTQRVPTVDNSNYHLYLYNRTVTGIGGTTSATAELYVNGSFAQGFTDKGFALNNAYTEKGTGTTFGGSNTTNTVYRADSYITTGVFDVYDLTGAAVKEYFYFDYDVMKNGVRTDAGLISYYHTGTLNYTGSNTAKTKGSNAFTIGANNTRATVYSGKMEETPIEKVYYDNVEATINWNKVDGATSYEYAIGNGAWTAVATNYVSVADEVANYAEYMPVKIRAIVDGTATKEVYYNARMGYQARSTVSDLMTEVRSVAIDEKATGITSTTSNAVKPNNYLTFSYDSVDGDRFLALYRKMTGSHHATDGCYAVNFWKNGIISVGMDAFGYYNSPSFDSDRVVEYFDIMETGTKYFVTFGVDDLYKDGVKVSEYVTLRVAVQDGFNEFKTVAVSNFENKNFATDEIDTENKTYTLWGKDAIGSSIVAEKKASSINLDGTLVVNGYMNIAAPNKATLGKLEMQTSYNGESVTAALPTPEQSGDCAGLYKFSQPVHAKEIDVPMSLTLYVGSGSGGVTYNFTAREYIDVIQADTEHATYSEAHYNLVTAVEDYCEAAAVYFGVEGATIADSTRIDGVTEEAFADHAATVERNGDDTMVGISLLTESATTIRIYVIGEQEPAITVEGNALTVQAAEGYFYADITDINGFNLGTKFEIKVGDSITISASALSYWAIMDKTNEDLVNVVKALYNYNACATAYNVPSAQ